MRGSMACIVEEVVIWFSTGSKRGRLTKKMNV